ncbi:MAG: TIGR03960 family B12-binding radical SAM protein [Clostridia bacterium]
MFSKEVEKILLEVEKPGRYTGGELNSVVKDKEKMDIRYAFCFPDTYEVGMSHLGMKILYSLINSREEYSCDRVFAPWTDMENKMRENNIPLYGLESGDPLSEFDMIGFTLQYELSFTNILNMLDLGGVPVLAKDRTELKNIVIGGGPCACNPEPLVDFFDMFALGDGEESTLEIIDLLNECKKKGDTKEDFLKKATQIGGIYVPSLYSVEYNDDKTIKVVNPIENAPKTVLKRTCMDLDSMYFPETFVVPFLDIVHNRAVAEVLRGCIRGCRFCQAGFLYRPFREKSVETIDKQCKILCENTGYDEISLSSLATNDLSTLNPLLDTLHMWTEDDKVSVSLPSLRVDSFSNELIEKISSVRKSGLTFAPEAGSQRMRDVINKNVTQQQLYDTVNIAFANGWSKVKLYFMIGLPTETIEDVEEITILGLNVIGQFNQNPNKPKGKGANVTVSAATFVPKPFTPFQWFGQDTIEVIEEKQSRLKARNNSKKLTVNYHESKTSFLEAVFARGDRKLSPVLYEAYKRGFKFDGWSQCFSYEAWIKLFKDLDIDMAFYANRHRSLDEVFPWEHLDYGVKKEFLLREYQKALSAETTENCREKCSNCGANKQCKGGICFGNYKDMV